MCKRGPKVAHTRQVGQKFAGMALWLCRTRPVRDIADNRILDTLGRRERGSIVHIMNVQIVSYRARYVVYRDGEVLWSHYIWLAKWLIMDPLIKGAKCVNNGGTII